MYSLQVIDFSENVKNWEVYSFEKTSNKFFSNH